MVLVLGSQNSSNSQRLAELARESGVPLDLIDGAADIDPAWFRRARDGAGHRRRERSGSRSSRQCLDFFRSGSAPPSSTRRSAREEVYFPLPRELRTIAAQGAK